MRKAVAMTLMLISIGLLFTGISLWKWFVHIQIKKAQQKNQTIAATVSSGVAKAQCWKSEIQVVGSARTVKGINVTTELAGMVTQIDFEPGTDVEKGKLLVQLDIAPETAKLHQLQAEAEIATITYHRDQKQYRVGGVSKETVDRDEANDKATAAEVAQQLAIIAEKTVRAPFSGRLGVSLVNPGQYIRPGDNIVTLETLKPIYIDFYVPQQEIPHLKVGSQVNVKIDAYAKKHFTGPVTTINPIVDQSVRNILVEATLPNEQEKILPGMFIYVTLPTGKPKKYITLPQMAITFNSYGSIVYVLKPTHHTQNNKAVWQVEQRFVTTGETRGNQISVLSGIKEGETVVTSGQLKIKNGSFVVINNAIQPPSNPDPNLPTE